MSGHEQDTDIRDSTPNSGGPDRAEGGMGVSSERVGQAGPGQQTTDGVRDTSPPEAGATEPDSADGEAEPVEGLAPKAGYPSLDPRSADKPYEASPDIKSL
ncbi:hypothetical protein G5V58_00815 [Nocardioides anomalus]|uniref:Uncharacterized protein n=1 Tax=Nocardioides anomalus TaxID=2712223 RepID=A0A6G6W8M4_9ACTN|nr:hypothetical protein [Nocardioides anomalus]QIG41503.1 hypothetical protein G5V58_00815 [Nocardioides anomalus]